MARVSGLLVRGALKRRREALVFSIAFCVDCFEWKPECTNCYGWDTGVWDFILGLLSNFTAAALERSRPISPLSPGVFLYSLLGKRNFNGKSSGD